MKLDNRIKAMPWPEKIEINDRIAYEVKAEICRINREEVYVITFIYNTKRSYWRAVSCQSFRIVASKKSKDYVILTEEGKRVKNIHNIINENPAYIYCKIGESAEKIIKKLCGGDSTNHYIDRLGEWCDEIRVENLRESKIKRDEIMDEEYNAISEELPEGFLNFIRRDILRNDRTITYKKGNVRGFCHFCGSYVRAAEKRFTQGVFLNCPVCGEKVHCVLEGSNVWSADYVENVAFAQKGKDGKTVFFRLFHIDRDNSGQYEPIQRYITEVARYAIRGKNVAAWVKERKESHWIGRCSPYSLNSWERYGRYHVYDGSYEFYDEGFEDVICGTELEYKATDRYLDEGSGADIIKYCIDAARYPLIEFLAKNGFWSLIAEKNHGAIGHYEGKNINFSAKTLKGALKFNPKLLKIFKTKDNVRVRDINRLSQICTIPQIRSDQIERIYNKSYSKEAIEKAAKYKSIDSILNFLDKQTKVETVCMIFNDYIRECELLELDLTDKNVIFPKDLLKAHERTSKAVIEQKTAIDKRQFKIQVKKQEKYSYENNGLCIRVARSRSELVKEGSALHHCVGTYAERMARGETTIFLIRKLGDEKTSYFTLELRGGKVIQCRGKNNKSYSQVKEVKDFVNEWLLFIEGMDKKCRKLA